MSINFEFHKLKKVSQDTLYKSIEDKLDISNSQVYLPFFPKYLKFHNIYSKRMFNLKGDYTILEIENIDENTKNKLQGKLNIKMVKNSLYTKAKNYNDYKNYIVEKETFIKSNSLVDVLKYMEGIYDFNNSIPSCHGNNTSNKINNPNNNAYIEVMGCYLGDKITKKKYSSIFPEYYGCFNGIANKYMHDISEDYNFITEEPWFNERNGNEFEIKYDNSLEDFAKLSLNNLEKIDYKKNNNVELNFDKVNIDGEIELDEEIDFGEEIELDLEEIYKSDNLDKVKVTELKEDNKEIKDDNSESDSDLSISDESWCSNSSDGSLLSAEYWVNVNKIPVQILCMESFNLTLTELEKQGIDDMEWLSILFQLCFGLSAAQEHIGFIHNDLHSDNIMFKNVEETFKYFRYKDIFFKVPTFGKELKIIDFARSIFKIKSTIYYSDVFEKNGDAGGQYGNPPSIYLKKKLNFNFDLARLSTTIIEFIDDDSPIFDLLIDWTKYREDGIDKNFNQLEDSFSLYIAITKYARNSLPKDQLLKDIFSVFRLDASKIPNEQEIYQF